MPQKATFIKVPPPPGGLTQNMPTDPKRRLPSSDIIITRAVPEDLPKIVEGNYLAFPQEWWEKKEPLALRPPTEAIRHERFIKRLRPTFTHPLIHPLVAKYKPTGEIIGHACWVAPGNPIHNYLRKTAVDFYNWRDQYNCTDSEFEEIWSSCDPEHWEENFAKTDQLRRDTIGEEPHWYLASLFTFPGWQGRGVAKLLLDWAIVQADATDPVTPMCLESMPAAKAVYMHCGFVPHGHEFVRRGPAVVRGLEADDEKGDDDKDAVEPKMDVS